MSEEEYQKQLLTLRISWGGVRVLPEMPGVVQAKHDPTTGILIGRHSEIISEIINRALRGEYDQR